MRRLEGIARQLDETPDGQISLTDPDARSMATYGKGTGLVGYNVQTAVDTDTHLIVAHEVTNVGNDRAQLAPMARAAKAALEAETLEAIADRGYFNGAELLACHEDRITATVPRPETSGNRKKGMFVKADFAYDAATDVYRCPAGKALTYRYTREEDGLMLRRYWQNDCQHCPLKSRCTTGKERRITRWEHEHLVEAMYARMERDPDLMRQTAQHGRTPFRHDQGLDGRDAFPDAAAAKRPHRDGAARPRLQHQADDLPGRRPSLVGRNPELKPAAAFSKSDNQPKTRCPDCVFRSIRSRVPTTSDRRFRGIRSPRLAAAELGW